MFKLRLNKQFDRPGKQVSLTIPVSPFLLTMRVGFLRSPRCHCSYCDGTCGSCYDKMWACTPAALNSNKESSVSQTTQKRSDVTWKQLRSLYMSSRRCFTKEPNRDECLSWFVANVCWNLFNLFNILKSLSWFEIRHPSQQLIFAVSYRLICLNPPPRAFLYFLLTYCNYFDSKILLN